MAGGVGERRVRRRGHQEEHDPLILDRRQFLAREHVERHREHTDEGAEGEDLGTEPQDDVEEHAVAVAQPVEGAADHAGEAAFATALRGHVGAHDRRQRDRDDRPT